jgi:2-keto-4-pentenoate hydratase/2-oxohepta-3-ene-1,7-dioic acid hydratase in catechol pathway
MKLASYRIYNQVSCGIVTDRGVIDIPPAMNSSSRLHSLREILIKAPHSFELLEEVRRSNPPVISLEDIQWLPPIPRPGKILALAGNYRKHVAETGHKSPLPEMQIEQTIPRPFLMPGVCATSHRTTVPWPLYSTDVDYEIELAVVVGRQAKALSPEAARSVIAGYTSANDISARTVTFAPPRPEGAKKDFFEWLAGKWSDSFCPMGPWMVTADEIPDPQNLALELKVNGQVRQKASTSEMTRSVFEIVSFLSHLCTLEPGDVICTGTPAGVGVTDGRMLSPGDTIDCTIEAIGTLTNTMGKKPERFYTGI